MARPKTPREPRPPAGTPTDLNLFTLDKEMRRAHGDGLGPLHEFESTSMAGMRRLLKAGYLAPAFGAPKGYWELTGQGLMALLGYRERDAAMKARWAKPGGSSGAASRRGRVVGRAEIAAPHDPFDKDLLKELVAAYKRGAAVTPIVVLDDGRRQSALTGSHRIAAMMKVFGEVPPEHTIVLSTGELKKALSAYFKAVLPKALTASEFKKIVEDGHRAVDLYMTRQLESGPQVAYYEDFLRALSAQGGEYASALEGQY